MMEGLRPYPKYKDSGVRWLGDVPEHWQTRKLRHLLFQETERNRLNLPLLSVVREKGVILRDISHREENRNYIPDDLSNYKVVRAGQFAMNKMKAWQGSYGVSQFDGIVSPAYFVFDLAGAGGPFFHRAIRSQAYVPFFTRASDGVRIGQWDLSQTGMREIPFYIPPLPEQTAIVRFLDWADGRIRRVIRARERRIKLLEEYKQALIHRAVTGQIDVRTGQAYSDYKPSGVEWLGDVPAHWDVRKLKHLTVSIQMGPFGASLTDLQTHDTGYKLFGQENTISGDFSRGRRWLTRTQFEALRRYELLPGDLVLTRKGSIGNCKMVPSNTSTGIADSDTIRVRLDRKQVLGHFVVLLLQDAAYVTRQIESVKRGAILPGLNTSTIGNLRLTGPPLLEQRALLRYIEAKTSTVSAAISADRRVIEFLKEYRTRLIADVVTGKLDVREAAAKLPDELSEVDGEPGDGKIACERERPETSEREEATS